MTSLSAFVSPFLNFSADPGLESDPHRRVQSVTLGDAFHNLLGLVFLVHEKGRDGTRVGLIVQPEQFSSVRLGLRARPTLVPLLSLGSAPRLGSMAASRVIHLEIRSPWPPGGCGVSSPLQLFGLLYLLIIVISWKCKRLQFVIQLSPWLSIICSERHLPV